MINIKKRLKEEQTGIRYRDEFDNPVSLEMTEEYSSALEHKSIFMTNEYLLKLTISTCYRCLPEDKQAAEANAIRTLQLTLYEDLVLELQKLRSLILDGKRQDALKQILKIEKEFLQ